MKRITLLLCTLLVVTACGSKPAPQGADMPVTPVAAAPEVSPSPVTPPPPAIQPTGLPSPVSSEISFINYPWITAPARVFMYDGKLLLRFSAPVDRDSVAGRLKYKVEWRSDQEATVSILGCSYTEVTAAGALDAEGRELTPDLNPVLALRFPCHGGNLWFVRLPEGKLPTGWPDSGSVVDFDPVTGEVIGSVGWLLFRFDLATGRTEKLAQLDQGVGFTKAAGRTILIVDKDGTRLIDWQNQVVRRFDVSGTLGTMVASPDSPEALLLLQGKAKEQYEAVYLNLASGAAKQIGTISWADSRPEVMWDRGTRTVQLSASWFSQGKNKPLLLNVDTGATTPNPAPGKATSPDGKWVAVQAPPAVYPAGQEGGAPLVALPDVPQVTRGSQPVWSPDSRYVLLSNGHLLEAVSWKQVANFDDHQCGPFRPGEVWTFGGLIYATYIQDCGP